MNISFEEQSWEIIDDFSDYVGWVGLSYGDIYIDDNAFGYYVAVWYLDKKQPAKMLITTVDEKLEAKCEIGVSIERHDNKLRVKPLSANELPWDNDEVISPENYSSYTRAIEALSIVEMIVKGDEALKKYLLNPNLIITKNISLAGT